MEYGTFGLNIYTMHVYISKQCPTDRELADAFHIDWRFHKERVLSHITNADILCREKKDYFHKFCKDIHSYRSHWDLRRLKSALAKIISEDIKQAKARKCFSPSRTKQLTLFN